MVLALVPLPTDATDAASCRDSTCACLCAVVRGRGGVPISVELVRRLPLSVPPGEVDVGPPPTSAADAIPHKQRTLPNRRHARRHTPRRQQRARRQGTRKNRMQGIGRIAPAPPACRNAASKRAKRPYLPRTNGPALGPDFDIRGEAAAAASIECAKPQRVSCAGAAASFDCALPCSKQSIDRSIELIE